MTHYEVHYDPDAHTLNTFVDRDSPDYRSVRRSLRDAGWRQRGRTSRSTGAVQFEMRDLTAAGPWIGQAAQWAVTRVAAGDTVDAGRYEQLLGLEPIDAATITRARIEEPETGWTDAQDNLRAGYAYMQGGPDLHAEFAYDNAFEVYAVDAADRLSQELQAAGLQPTKVIEYQVLDTRNVGTFRETASNQLQPQAGTEQTIEPSYWMRMHAPLPAERPSWDFKEQPQVDVTVAVFDRDQPGLRALYERAKEQPDTMRVGLWGNPDSGVSAIYAANASQDLADDLSRANVMPDEIHTYRAIDTREPGRVFPQIDDLKPDGAVHEPEPAHWMRTELRTVDPVRDFIRESYAQEHGHRRAPGTSAGVAPTVRAERDRPPTLER